MRRLFARALCDCAQWIDTLARWLLALSVRLDPGPGVLGGRAVPPALRLPWQPAPAPPHWERLVRQHAPQLLARRHDAVPPVVTGTADIDPGKASPAPAARSPGAAAAVSVPSSSSPAARSRGSVPPAMPARSSANRHTQVASPGAAPASGARDTPGDPPRPSRPPALGAPRPPRPITPEPRTAPPRGHRAALESGGPDSPEDRHDPPRAERERNLARLDSGPPGPVARPERRDSRAAEPDRDLARVDRGPARLDPGPAGLERRVVGSAPVGDPARPDRGPAGDSVSPERHHWPALPDQWAPSGVPTPDPPSARPSLAGRYPSLPDDGALWTEMPDAGGEPDPDTAEHLARLAGEQRGRSWNG